MKKHFLLSEEKESLPLPYKHTAPATLPHLVNALIPFCRPMIDIFEITKIVKLLKEFHSSMMLLNLLDTLSDIEKKESLDHAEQLAQTITMLINQKLAMLFNDQLSMLLYEAAILISKTLPINQADYFTLIPFNSIDKQFIVTTSDRYQFDIRELASWLNIKNKWTHPVLPTQSFSSKNKETIYQAAKQAGVELKLKPPTSSLPLGCTVQIIPISTAVDPSIFNNAAFSRSQAPEQKSIPRLGRCFGSLFSALINTNPPPQNHGLPQAPSHSNSLLHG